MFDFNFDGKIDAFEMGLGLAMIDEFEKEQAKEEMETDLLSVGLDPLDLEFMDADERDELLIENGLDPDDFEDFDF